MAKEYSYGRPVHFLPTDEWINKKGEKKFNERCKTPDYFEPDEFKTETITVANALRFPKNIKLYAYSPEKKVEIDLRMRYQPNGILN